MTPDQIAYASQRKLNGDSIEVIGPALGVHPSTVYRNLQRPEVKAKIEAEAEQIITRGLSQARRTIVRLAAMGNTKHADKDALKLALDASKHITSIAGLSGNTPSTVIQALININNPEPGREVDAITLYLQDKAWAMDPTTIDVPASHTPPDCLKTDIGTPAPEAASDRVTNDGQGAD